MWAISTRFSHLLSEKISQLHGCYFHDSNGFWPFWRSWPSSLLDSLTNRVGNSRPRVFVTRSYKLAHWEDVHWRSARVSFSSAPISGRDLESYGERDSSAMRASHHQSLRLRGVKHIWMYPQLLTTVDVVYTSRAKMCMNEL